MFDGRSAVTMFFVLSGFVLTRPYFSANNSDPPRQLLVPEFYIRRITRIWIPWFAIFCLSAFLKAYVFRSYPTAPPVTKWFDAFWRQPLSFADVRAAVRVQSP